MVIYFTGTGSSRYTAEAVADRLNDTVFCANDFIKKNEKCTLNCDKPWIFVFPIYLSTMPAIFMEFIRSSEFSGSKKAYFIGCCASSVGSAPNRCVEICTEKGWEYMGIARVKMPQNYIVLFRMTEKDEIQRRLSDALKAADDISSAVKAANHLDMKLTSKAEYSMVKIVEKMYNGPFTGTKQFHANDKCSGCGLCEKVCPLNRIHISEHGKPEWNGSCIHCMSCINRCPKQAIEYGKKTIGKSRYVCEKYTSE